MYRSVAEKPRTDDPEVELAGSDVTNRIWKYRIRSTRITDPWNVTVCLVPVGRHDGYCWYLDPGDSSSVPAAGTGELWATREHARNAAMRYVRKHGLPR